MVKIKDVVQKEGDRLQYEYDMGDGWMHTVVLEKIVDGVLKGAKCLVGAGAAPTEDCGGVH